MTNVLPLDAQKKLWGIHRARFIIIFSLVLIALAVVALLALVPSFAALEANTLSEEEISAQGTTAAENMRDMAKSQTLLTAVQPTIAATSSPMTMIGKVLALRPKGATVQRIKYSDTARSVQIDGMASRDMLTTYRTALEKDGSFSSVSVPFTAVVGSSGQYSITVIGK